MATSDVRNLNNGDYAVIDLDSGTVLGTNVVLVRIPQDEAEWEDIISNDSNAWEYGTENALPLAVEL